MKVVAFKKVPLHHLELTPPLLFPPSFPPYPSPQALHVPTMKVVALKKVPLHHPERMQQILSELRALQANMVSITAFIERGGNGGGMKEGGKKGGREEGVELFPHVYGGIPPKAVVGVLQVRRGEDGRFLGIEGMEEEEK